MKSAAMSIVGKGGIIIIWQCSSERGAVFWGCGREGNAFQGKHTFSSLILITYSNIFGLCVTVSKRKEL